MSDKNEYWRELFGVDSPEDTNIGENEDSRQPSAETESDWFSFDDNFFKDPPKMENEGDSFSDTNVIPNDITDLSYVTKGISDPEPDAAEPVDEDDEYEEKAIRHEKRKRRGCVGGIMFFVFIAGISALLACIGWLAAGDVLALNKEYLEAEITVPENFTVSDVTDDLKDEGLIEYKFLFNIFAGVYNADEKIEPGTYILNTEYDYRALIAYMKQSGDNKVGVTVTIPEGKTLAELFAILEEEEVCTTENLMDVAANYDFDYEFLDSGTLGDATRLEGYLFPDTYEFYKNINASMVIDKLLSNFDSRMTANGIYKAVEASEYTLSEILTVASLLEKEAASAEEMPVIASVIYNRLNGDQLLQIDATIQYILDERKEILTTADTEIDSPYNTYLYPGLTPTPIANPGITAIKAALAPESTNYYYYALHVDKYHVFFQYYDSHQEFTQSEEFAYYSG